MGERVDRLHLYRPPIPCPSNDRTINHATRRVRRTVRVLRSAMHGDALRHVHFHARCQRDASMKSHGASNTAAGRWCSRAGRSPMAPPHLRCHPWSDLSGSCVCHEGSHGLCCDTLVYTRKQNHRLASCYGVRFFRAQIPHRGVQSRAPPQNYRERPLWCTDAQGTKVN